MLSSQIEQEERKRTLDNDRKVREGGTFLAHALADAELPRGRFNAIANAQVVGAQPIPNYPAAAAHQADPCGPERQRRHWSNATDSATGMRCCATCVS